MILIYPEHFLDHCAKILSQILIQNILFFLPQLMIAT